MHHPQENQPEQATGQKKVAAVQQVKLQQMQDEFLKWLDSMENTQSDLDQYAYKKVR